MGPNEKFCGAYEESAVAVEQALRFMLMASDGRGARRRFAVEEGSGSSDRG